MRQDEFHQRRAQCTPRAYSICAAMQSALDRLGLAVDGFADPALVKYRLENDPASGQASLVGEWRDIDAGRRGGLWFHADGSFFAEYDVVRLHPQRQGIFVEAITAWGRDELIKVEPRLLDCPE